jgi:putative ABC transport system permease protein
VLPGGFSFPGKTAVWFEATAYPKWGNRTAYNQQAIGKRRAGISNAQLAAELDTFSHRLQVAFLEDRYKSLEAVPLQEQLVGKVRPTLHLLMGSVAVILLIVCANVTHLQLVRATRQLRATTIRTALGASRRVLAGQALLEAVLLAVAGSAGALLLAAPALRLLIHLAPPDVPRLAEVHLNADVLLFSFVASLVLMSLTSVAPVWRSWRIDPAIALRQDASRGGEGRATLRLRNSFVVVEIALTITLSVAAVVLTRQLIEQSRADLGFSPEHLITLDTHAVLSTPAPVAKDDSPGSVAALKAEAALKAGWDAINEQNLATLDAAIASVATVPGVESAGAIDGAPMDSDGSDVSFAVRGRQVFAPGVEHLPNAEFDPITPNLLAALGVPLLRGRALSADDRQNTPPVVLINQELARQVFPGQDPIGQQIMCGYDETSAWMTIVGITGNIRASSPGRPPYPAFYAPVAQHPRVAPDMQLVVRVHGDPAVMAESLRRRLLVTHPDIAVKATTMQENIGQTERPEEFRTVLFASFAGVSILLAAIGMYGVTSYTVSQRSFEFGLRIAVGATQGQVFGQVLRNALGSGLAGVGTGIVLSTALVRLLAGVAGTLPMPGIAPYAISGCAVLMITLLASLLPARRAAQVNPIEALRME